MRTAFKKYAYISMKALKLLYPNHYCGSKVFHWGLCGKKLWDRELGEHYIELSPNSRFIHLETGEAFLPTKKLKVLLRSTHNPKELLEDIERGNMDGTAIFSSSPVRPGWYSSPDFFFIRGIQVLGNNKPCPLINFVRINNSRLRHKYPQLPLCKDLSRETCQSLVKILDSEGIEDTLYGD